MRYLFLLFYESSQLFLFCHVRVFLPCNFSRIHRKIPFLIHRYIHVTGPILFFSSTLSFSLPPLTSRRRRRNSKTNSTAEKEEKEEEKEEEKNEKERGRGRKRERGKEIHPSARRSSVPALYTRDGWILRARDVLLSFPFLHVPRSLHSYRSSFLFSVPEDGY